ncbi:MAG: hypothetical protein IPP81_13165 [Chitinophagaceae bacterium]|nr:hypothetical protein [Chitinophagaceae bacterium]
MFTTYTKRFLVFTAISLFSGFAATAQNSVVKKYETGNVFAGIEVGSKGVKMSMVELDKHAGEDGEFKILKDTSINTDFISFTQPTYQATLAALNRLYEIAVKQNRIPVANVFTAISSGVNIQAQKEDKKIWIDQLINAFRLNNNEPDRKVAVIDVVEEARLSHLGIVPEARRYNTFLIDIGSGNTKGGYFPYGTTKDFRLFQLTWGTKSTFNAAEKMLGDDKGLENFNSQLNRVLAGAENNEIVYAVNASGAFPKSDNIAFSGGIAWAVATLIAPELNDNAVVGVTYDDVIEFTENLSKNPSLYSDYYIVKRLSENSVDAEKLERDVKQVNKVFDQRSLLAGAGLLLKIMRQFDGVIERKKFYLVKNGSVGWISAYVNQHVTK